MTERVHTATQSQNHSSRYQRRKDHKNTFNSSRTVNELREENTQLIEVIKVITSVFLLFSNFSVSATFDHKTPLESIVIV